MITFTNKEEKQALIRIQKLKELSKLLTCTTNDSSLEVSFQTESTLTETAYKRRGIVLKQIPHTMDTIKFYSL